MGFYGECNAWQRPVPEQDYKWMAHFEGSSLLAAIEHPETFLLPETRGFFAGMTETGPWEPVPILYANRIGPGADGKSRLSPPAREDAGRPRGRRVLDVNDLRTRLGDRD